MDQVMIAIFGATAIWLTQQKNEKLKKYACLLGMASQPFWYYAAYTAEQWGIFGVSFIYTYSWAVGIKNNWITKYA